jgi:hypothetical protein
VFFLLSFTMVSSVSPLASKQPLLCIGHMIEIKFSHYIIYFLRCIPKNIHFSHRRIISIVLLVCMSF